MASRGSRWQTAASRGKVRQNFLASKILGSQYKSKEIHENYRKYTKIRRKFFKAEARGALNAAGRGKPRQAVASGSKVRQNFLASKIFGNQQKSKDILRNPWKSNEIQQKTRNPQKT